MTKRLTKAKRERLVAELVEYAEMEAAPEWALDELVYDCATEGMLDDINSTDVEDEQEGFIRAAEADASGTNNGGFEAQVRYLLGAGCTREEIVEALDDAD